MRNTARQEGEYRDPLQSVEFPGTNAGAAARSLVALPWRVQPLARTSDVVFVCRKGSELVARTTNVTPPWAFNRFWTNVRVASRVGAWFGSGGGGASWATQTISRSKEVKSDLPPQTQPRNTTPSMLSPGVVFGLRRSDSSPGIYNISCPPLFSHGHNAESEVKATSSKACSRSLW